MSLSPIEDCFANLIHIIIADPKTLLKEINHCIKNIEHDRLKTILKSFTIEVRCLQAKKNIFPSLAADGSKELNLWVTTDAP